MSTDDHITFSADMHETFQQRASDFLAPTDREEENGDELPETGVLTGWFLVTSWTGTDGGNWIAYHHALQQPMWISRGLLLEAANDL